jgi:sigma-B regulation protein RsbU (phosphoserine phosphatase)
MSDNSTEQLRLENQNLRRAVEELSTLNDLARAIGASLNLPEIMNVIIRRSLRAINAEQGMITLSPKGETDPMKTLVRDMTSSKQHQPFHLDQNLMGWMQSDKKSLMINDFAKDKRFQGIKWDQSIRNLICVPLLAKSELIGILTIINKKQDLDFSDADLRLLSIIAAQSAQIVENARLYEEEQTFLKVQEEIKIASKIQHDLLPKQNPQIEGYDIAGKNISAQLVGGDYYDFIQINQDRIALCLGDVSGKGLPAAILMANLQAAVRSQAILNVSAQDCTQRANKLLFKNTSTEKFVTLFYAVLDAKRHELVFSNAGHDNPFLLRDKKVTRLEAGGTVLGFIEDVPFEQETMTLLNGDVLLVYSDGITEAMDVNGKEFGEERLGEVVIANREKSAEELIDTILASVKEHTGAQPQMDDMTIMIVKKEK